MKVSTNDERDNKTTRKQIMRKKERKKERENFIVLDDVK